MATLGAADRTAAAPGGLAAGDRARPPQRRGAVLADRVGREVHRLRAGRDRAGNGADLLAPDRPQVPPARARRGRARGGSVPRPRRRGLRGRRSARGWRLGRRRDARRRARLGLLRRGRDLQPAEHRRTPGPVLATGCMLAASVFLLPLALASPPTSVPTTGAIASLLLLALFGTALAQLVLFRVVRLFGARRLSLVTYLLPGFALVYGAVILDERVGRRALVGLALILAGVALGSGTLRLRRRAAATVTSAERSSLGSLRRRLDEDAEAPWPAGSRGRRARSPRASRRCGRARARTRRRCRSRLRGAARSASRGPWPPGPGRSPR